MGGQTSPIILLELVAKVAAMAFAVAFGAGDEWADHREMFAIFSISGAGSAMGVTAFLDMRDIFGADVGFLVGAVGGKSEQDRTAFRIHGTPALAIIEQFAGLVMLLDISGILTTEGTVWLARVRSALVGLGLGCEADSAIVSGSCAWCSSRADIHHASYLKFHLLKEVILISAELSIACGVWSVGLGLVFPVLLGSRFGGFI